VIGRRHSEESIREAFDKLWRAATGKKSGSLMSIPPRPMFDADFILSDAIDELMKLRQFRNMHLATQMRNSNEGEKDGTI
jgi:hypothetical protein